VECENEESILADDPYSLEQLRDPRMNISVVRPLVDKLYELDDVSISKPQKPLSIRAEDSLIHFGKLF
jgi:hypothetical protein